MTYSNRIAFLSLVFSCFAMSTQAAELNGVKMDDSVTLGGKTLVLNGMGLRAATIFKVKVYVGGLYLEAKSQDPSAILESKGLKKVEMRFLRDVSAEKIRDAWSKSFTDNCGAQCEALKPRFDSLNQMMPEFKNGDSLQLAFHPDRVEISYNGAEKGKITGEDFARALLTTWMGNKPPSDELKAGMLGK